MAYNFLIIPESYIYTIFLAYITKDYKRSSYTLGYYSLAFNYAPRSLSLSYIKLA